MPIFTPHQDAALVAAANWLKTAHGHASIFRLFGYAGTGKTTLAKHIAEGVDGKVLFAAFTGKAACVMRSKGCRGASTIHSLIYRPLESKEEQPSFELWQQAPASNAKLIIIDECSMVDAELGRDLMSFGVPLLVLGDPAQLPPIQGGGFFTDAKPDAMLTEVHRQARDNPIVRLSMDIRAGHALAEGQYGDSQVVGRKALEPKRVLDADQVLVERDAARLQCPPARAPRVHPGLADDRRQARLPAQQPAQGVVQRRALGGNGEAEDTAADHPHAAAAGRRSERAQREGLGAAGMLHRRHRGACLARTQEFRDRKS